jgi:hypothetical protein
VFRLISSVSINPTNQKMLTYLYSHRHTESLLEEHGFSGELDGKDWDAYNAYVASIDTVLQKKGLRYGKLKG